MRSMIRGIVLLIALAGLACTDATRVRVERDLRSARLRWRAAGPADYSYTVALSCFCPRELLRPVRVTVSHDSVVNLVYADSLTPADTAGLSRLLTVNRLFDYLESILAAGPDKVYATFDGVLGHPLEISVNPDQRAADGGFGISTSDLSPVVAASGRP